MYVYDGIPSFMTSSDTSNAILLATFCGFGLKQPVDVVAKSGYLTVYFEGSVEHSECFQSFIFILFSIFSQHGPEPMMAIAFSVVRLSVLSSSTIVGVFETNSYRSEILQAYLEWYSTLPQCVSKIPWNHWILGRLWSLEIGHFHTF